MMKTEEQEHSHIAFFHDVSHFKDIQDPFSQMHQF